MKSLLVLALLGGCGVCEPDHLIRDAAAPAKPYASEINACITRHDCDLLCEQLFVLEDGQTMTACRIEHVDAQGTADVRVFFDDANVCAAEGGGDVYVDDGTDDGSTDTGDDGGGDDGSDTGDDGGGDGTDTGETGDDGGGDDGSTDTGDDGGGDDGGGDDGSTGDYRHAPRDLPRALISPARR